MKTIFLGRFLVQRFIFSFIAFISSLLLIFLVGYILLPFVLVFLIYFLFESFRTRYVLKKFVRNFQKPFHGQEPFNTEGFSNKETDPFTKKESEEIIDVSFKEIDD